MNLPLTGGPGTILTVNVGSSSLRFAVFEEGELRASGMFERLGSPGCTWSAQVDGSKSAGSLPKASPVETFELLDKILTGFSFAAVAHRIVHGGEKFPEHCLVNDAVLSDLKTLKPLAPEHLPCEIRFLETARAHYGRIPMIACFDTVFHAQLPEVARTYALPEKVRLGGVRRFGFHGLSYASQVRRLREMGQESGRSVLAHLGNGASMAAVCDGVSVDTTMGFTPAAGLVMGTRCGDIDPGIFRFLASRGESDPVALDHLFNHESGLAGLSGIGSDIRDLTAAADHSPAARLALGVFCHVAVKQAAGMAASLGGIDRLVFAGGIGEHATSIRQRICEGLGFLGVTLDMEANANSAPKISVQDSRVDVLILPADEEREMAHIAGSLACSQIN